MKSFFEENSEVVYLGAGSFFAFCMALLRSAKYTKKHFITRLTEALMCSMLASALVIGLVEYFHVSFIWAIPVGTFIGFVGTDFIHAVIVGLVEYHALKNQGKLNKD